MSAIQIEHTPQGHPVMSDWLFQIGDWTTPSFRGCLCADCVSEGNGIVYVLSNPAFQKDVYKIGYTSRHLEKRVDELSASTGCPTPFRVAFAGYCKNARQVESIVHKRLSMFRVNSSREFFNLSLRQIVRIINIAAYQVSEMSSWEEAEEMHP